MASTRAAKFTIGQVVRHRLFPFRGVIFDIDPEFNNSDEWYESIPAEVRPRKDQPFYHLLAENADTEYVAYVSEQNLLEDEFGRSCPSSSTRGDVRPHGRWSLQAESALAALSGLPSRKRAAEACYFSKWRGRRRGRRRTRW